MIFLTTSLTNSQVKNNLSFHQGGATVDLWHQSPDKLEWIFPIPSLQSFWIRAHHGDTWGEQSGRAALGLQAGVWRAACMPRACAAHSQESQQAQHSPCRSAGSAHPSQVQAWLCGKGCQLSSSSPEWSATEVVRERHGFALSSRLPDCSWCTLEPWCCQPPWLQIQ